MPNSIKNPIRVVKSAGGVVISGDKKVLFCHPTSSRWDNWRMPKGRIGAGEPSMKAALREVFEETGFRCKIVRKIDSEAEYRSRDELGTIWKRVVLYLMEPIEEARKPDGEMDSFRWVPFDKIQEYAAKNELPLIMEAVESFKSLHEPTGKKSNSKHTMRKKP